MCFVAILYLSESPNLQFIRITLIFLLIFGQNFGIWPPGASHYMVTPLGFALYF